MRFFTGLPVLAALALALAAPAHAFTIENQGTTNTYTVNNYGANNYGSTLETPGQPRGNFGDALSTPSTSNTGTTMGGFSFHVGPQSGFGASNLRPPAWSTTPLFLERNQ
jgi:hypothetical protein